MAFIDVRWFKRQGIIVCQELYSNKFKFFIGLEYKHFTQTEMDDIEGIMVCGSTFPDDVGRVLFPKIDYANDSYSKSFPEDLI